MSDAKSPNNTLASLEKAALTFQRGIEREGLRVDEAGNLARTPHPAEFGSKLSHPMITTDFSESQLELITPVSDDLAQTFTTLDKVHQVITRGMGSEILWAASMPCVLQGDPTIPLADYGESNLGKLKKTYRNGLGNRYGRSMQTICAVHYNFSFPDSFWSNLATIEKTSNDRTYRDRRFFDLIRNFRRFSWLPIFLFGASPAVCNSFVKGRDHKLEPFDEGSLHLPYATSLRSGNLGYQSDAQASNLKVSYENLASYVQSLADGVTTGYEGYEKIGIKNDEEYLQLNDCILQSEAEFYSTIRAKRVAPSGENFLQCLLDEGVEYIEVRLMDLDPFEPLGISQQTVRFLDTFLLYCLLADSPKNSDELDQEVKSNVTLAVHEGRKPDMELMDNGEARTLTDWASDILAQMTDFAAHLDSVHGIQEHADSLNIQRTKIKQPEHTPSARILADMKEQTIPFFRFAMNQSLAHKQTHLESELSPDTEKQFADFASQSLKNQADIDAASEPSFEQYLADILAGYPPLNGS